MSWIENNKESKPDIDKKYKDEKYTNEVVIHLKNGLNFLAYYDYTEEAWWSEITRIEDGEVMFWCKIPRLPKKNVQKEEI